MEVKFKIFRYDPKIDKGPYYAYYTLSAEPGDRLLDCLNKIKWEQDGTLSYRMSCGHGVCGSDAMKINGTCGLPCQKVVKNYQCPEVVLEPLPFFKIVKDLVVDMDFFLDGIHAVRPYLISSSQAPRKERRQSPEENQRTEDVIRCILCGCCTAACPVMKYNSDYIGPAAIVWAFRYIFDSRDDQTEERLRQMNHPNGVWPCVSHFECTRVCPKNIPVTKSITKLKMEISKSLPEDEGP